MSSLSRKAALVGVAEFDCGTVPDKTAVEMMAQATGRALEDAGLAKKDIDALFVTGVSPMPTTWVSEYLGIQPRFTDSTIIGGASFELHVGHALASINAGLCHTALICFGSTVNSDRKRGKAYQPPLGHFSASGEFELPFGSYLASSYALAAQRHMFQYGTTGEQLAEIAVATRKWASMNPIATHRNLISIQDVLNSPMIASPLHLLDCCLVSDGGGAVIVTSEERARGLRKPPVWVLGCSEAYSHNSIANMPDFTVTPATQAGERAFRMAGLATNDIDFLEIYDSFTITVLLQLEDLGFCKKGEGGAFVSGQRTAPGGPLPVNTNGGGLSFIHTGMYGIFLLIEATRQLRGECGQRQVPRHNIALCNGMGGELSCSSTVILGRD